MFFRLRGNYLGKKWLEKNLIRLKTRLYRGFRACYSLVGRPRRVLEELVQQGLISCELTAVDNTDSRGVHPATLPIHGNTMRDRFAGPPPQHLMSTRPSPSSDLHQNGNKNNNVIAALPCGYIAHSQSDRALRRFDDVPLCGVAANLLARFKGSDARATLRAAVGDAEDDGSGFSISLNFLHKGNGEYAVNPAFLPSLPDVWEEGPGRDLGGASSSSIAVAFCTNCRVGRRIPKAVVCMGVSMSLTELRSLDYQEKGLTRCKPAATRPLDWTSFDGRFPLCGTNRKQKVGFCHVLPCRKK